MLNKSAQSSAVLPEASIRELYDEMNQAQISQRKAHCFKHQNGDKKMKQPKSN